MRNGGQTNLAFALACGKLLVAAIDDLFDVGGQVGADTLQARKHAAHTLKISVTLDIEKLLQALCGRVKDDVFNVFVPQDISPFVDPEFLINVFLIIRLKEQQTNLEHGGAAVDCGDLIDGKRHRGWLLTCAACDQKRIVLGRHGDGAGIIVQNQIVLSLGNRHDSLLKIDLSRPDRRCP